MATNKKPRKKYRPKRNLQDPVAYTIESITPITKHGSYLLDIKIKNHGAMTALMRGKATRADMISLSAMHNMIEALFRMGFGKEYEDVLIRGYAALTAVIARGLPTEHFILRAPEIAALNEHLELHDAMMDVITIRDVEEALSLIRKEYAEGKMTRVVDLFPEYATV